MASAGAGLDPSETLIPDFHGGWCTHHLSANSVKDKIRKSEFVNVILSFTVGFIIM